MPRESWENFWTLLKMLNFLKLRFGGWPKAVFWAKTWRFVLQANIWRRFLTAVRHVHRYKTLFLQSLKYLLVARSSAWRTFIHDRIERLLIFISCFSFNWNNWVSKWSTKMVGSDFRGCMIFCAVGQRTRHDTGTRARGLRRADVEDTPLGWVSETSMHYCCKTFAMQKEKQRTRCVSFYDVRARYETLRPPQFTLSVAGDRWRLVLAIEIRQTLKNTFRSV